MYFVDASCFDTELQKMLSGEMCFALQFPSLSPSQEKGVFGSLSPSAQSFPGGKFLRQLPCLRVVLYSGHSTPPQNDCVLRPQETSYSIRKGSLGLKSSLKSEIVVVMADCLRQRSTHSFLLQPM